MGRRVAIPPAPLPPPNPDLEAFLGPEPKKRKKGLKGISPSDIKQASDEADIMRLKNEWVDARPIHFIALFRTLHQGVYGFPAYDLDDGKIRKHAVLAVARFLKDTFRGDPFSLSVFFWWAWIREEGREKWRREKKRSGSRLTWRRLFNVQGSDYTEWHHDMRRRRIALPPCFQKDFNHEPIDENGA